MRRTIFAGLILAAVAWVLLGTTVFGGGDPGPDLIQGGMLGAAVGAALALVPYSLRIVPGDDAGSPPTLGPPSDGLAARAIAWALGLFAAWAGYAMWAAVLPDTGSGRAAGAVIVVLVLTLAAAAANGRLPFWAMLLGVASLIGAYEATFSAEPTAFVGDSTTAATRVALATALAFCAVALVAHPLAPGHGDPLEDERVNPELADGLTDDVPEPLLVGDAEVPRAREATDDATDFRAGPADTRGEL